MAASGLTDKSKQNTQVVDATIRAYFTRKVRERFAEDFWLIEQELDAMISQHDLKELIAAVSIRIDQIKTSSGN